MESIGRSETDEPIHLVSQAGDCTRRRDRHSEHQRRRARLAQGSCRSLGRAAGGNAVINDDDVTPPRRSSHLVAEIKRAAAREFMPLPLGLRLDVALGRIHAAHGLGIEHDLRSIAVDECPDTVFRMARRTDLSNDEKVERRGENFRNLEGDRHAPARQGHHQRLGEALLTYGMAKPSPRIGPVCKNYAFLRHDIRSVKACTDNHNYGESVRSNCSEFRQLSLMRGRYQWPCILAETQAALYFSTTGRFEMSFLSAIPAIALLAMLPVLASLRRMPVAGVREIALGCVLSAASAAALTVATAMQAPIAAMFGYAGLVVTLFLVLRGLQRFFALSMPTPLFLVLAFSSGVVGFIIALGGNGSAAATIIVVAGVTALPLLILGLAAANRWPKEMPVIQVVIIGSVVVVFTALAHILGPSSHFTAERSGSPGFILFDFLVVTMQALCLPLVFIAVILTMQARIIAALRAAIARDGLTGALSRGALMEEGEQIFAECLTRRRPAAFLLLDLDFFKQINDQYGHACGDMALAHFADTVSTFLAGRGVLGRIGGEEFGIVLPDHTEEQAKALAEEICRIVRETPAGRSHQRIRLTVSIGIAAATAHETIADVMIRADLALYDSKADGRDRCTIARDRRIDSSARALAAAAAQLREARAGRPELRHSA